jgi:hypothetical protein
MGFLKVSEGFFMIAQSLVNLSSFSIGFCIFWVQFYTLVESFQGVFVLGKLTVSYSHVEVDGRVIVQVQGIDLYTFVKFVNSCLVAITLE